jgi:hypothetical protein
VTPERTSLRCTSSSCWPSNDVFFFFFSLLSEARHLWRTDWPWWLMPTCLRSFAVEGSTGGESQTATMFFTPDKNACGARNDFVLRIRRKKNCYFCFYEVPALALRLLQLSENSRFFQALSPSELQRATSGALFQATGLTSNG